MTSPVDHRGPFSFVDQYFVLSGDAFKPFLGSNTGLLTPEAVDTALHWVVHRVLAEREQGAAFCASARDLLMAVINPLTARQPQPPNPLQNGPEQFQRDRHFRHLEDHLPGMAHDLRPDFDQRREDTPTLWFIKAKPVQTLARPSD